MKFVNCFEGNIAFLWEITCKIVGYLIPSLKNLAHFARNQFFLTCLDWKKKKLSTLTCRFHTRWHWSLHWPLPIDSPWPDWHSFHLLLRTSYYLQHSRWSLCWVHGWIHGFLNHWNQSNKIDRSGKGEIEHTQKYWLQSYQLKVVVHWLFCWDFILQSDLHTNKAKKKNIVWLSTSDWPWFWKSDFFKLFFILLYKRIPTLLLEILKKFFFFILMFLHSETWKRLCFRSLY